MATWKKVLHESSPAADFPSGVALANLGGGNGSTFLRKDGQWATPTDTNTTYSAGTGLTLTGTTFSLTNTYDNYGSWTLNAGNINSVSSGKTVTLSASGATSISQSVSSGNHTITISSTDTNTNTTYSAGTGLSLSSTTFSISTGGVGTSQLADNSINGNKLASGAVNHPSKISNDVINSEHYAAGSIDAEHLASNSVTNAKIADNAVQGDIIADETIAAGKLADDSVASDNIIDGAIVGSKLSTNAVNSSTKLGSNVVTTDKINNGAVTLDKMANDSIRGQHLDATNSPTTGYYLSSSPTPQGMTWVPPVVAHNYVVFNHNFADDIGTSEIYIPWTGISESTTTGYVSNSFMLVPFSNMKFRRFMFRIHTVNQLSATLTVDLKKITNNSTTISTLDTVNLSISYYNNYGQYTIEDGTGSSQFSADVLKGDMVGFSVDASVDWAGHSQYFATSVWEIEGTSIG